MKKISKRAIAILLCLAVFFAVIPALTFAEDGRDYKVTIYVNGATGVDTNNGRTPENPVKTLTGAYKNLYSALGDTNKNDPDVYARLLITGNVDVTADGSYGGSKHKCTVVITAESPDLGYNLSSKYYTISGPTVYENMTIRHVSDTNLRYFCAGGQKLVIGENVTCVANGAGYYYNIAGMSYYPSSKPSGTSDVTVNSGTWLNIYVGNYSCTDNTVASNGGTVIFNGGTVTNSITPSYRSPIEGDMNVIINGGHVKNLRRSLGQYVDTSVKAVSGNINVKAGDCVIDNFLEADCGGTAYTEFFASAGKTLKIGGKTITADKFTGGGALTVDADCSADFGEVTGSTELGFATRPSSRTYVTAPETTPDDAFTCADFDLTASVEGGKKVWSLVGVKPPVLCINAPADTTLKVYTGFNDGTLLTPTRTEQKGNTVDYVFENPAIGNYRYHIKGTGYYSVKKLIYYDGNDKYMNADPGKHSGSEGYDPRTEILEYTDEILSGPLASSTDMFGEYNRIFNTPYFTNTDRPRHQITTQDEMMEYIVNHDDENDNMYVFNMGQSPVYNYDMPLIIFTKFDLSGAKTISEAAAIINAHTDMPTVMYGAQIHGCETSATEGALAMLNSLDGDYGDTLLESINILLVPRYNPEGSRAYTRRNVNGNLDMNREHMYQQTPELQYVHGVFNAFMPQMYIDCHEFQGGCYTAATLDDLYFSFNQYVTADDRINKAVHDISYGAIESISSKPYGLRMSYYPSEGGGGVATNRAYYSNYNTVCLLIETRGWDSGLNYYARRVAAQYMAVEYVLNYAAENADTLLNTVNTVREEATARGRIYDDGDVVIVRTATDQERTYDYYDKVVYNWSTGKVSSKSHPGFHAWSKPVYTRPAATAYVVPLGESFSENVRTVIERNNLKYYTIEPGSALNVCQYYIEEGADYAEIGDEKNTIFDKGAMVVTAAQPGATILGILMEPTMKMASGYSTSLVEMGILSAKDGKYPIYRYQHDLEPGDTVKLERLREAPAGLESHDPAAEGEKGRLTGLVASETYEYGLVGKNDQKTVSGVTEIDGLEAGKYYIRYTASGTEPASDRFYFVITDPFATEITVFVDTAAGNDSNSGLDEEEPLGTLDAAYTLLKAKFAENDRLKEAKIVLTGEVSYTAEKQFPECDFPVTITGSAAGATVVSTKSIYFNGPTTIENLTLKINVGSPCYIGANGHDFTAGKNITSVGFKSGSDTYYFSIAGTSGSAAVTGDFTIRVQSGRWRMWYISGTLAPLTGNVTLIGENCIVDHWILSGYNNVLNGDLYVELTNVTGVAKLHGGPQTKPGAVNGDVTLVMNEGTKIKDVFAGTNTGGNVHGTVTVIQNGATVTGITEGQSYGRTGEVDKSVLIIKSGSLPGGYVHFDEVRDLTAITYTPGDLDGDGEVSDADAVYLLFHTFFPEDYPVDQPIDFDGDGETTDADAVYLLFYTFFPEDYPI